MPPPGIIVAQLASIASHFVGVAILWHVIVGGAIVAWKLGWRPREQGVAAAMLLPIASFAAIAASAGNPFNAVAGALAIVALRLAARTIPNVDAARGDDAGLAAGWTMVVFGWVYPHFVATGTPLAYLYAAPLGVLPCPTLAMLVGFTLITGGLRSRWWAAVLGTIALFYGSFGVFYLGVWLDVVLVCGALVLLGRAALRRAAESQAVAHAAR